MKDLIEFAFNNLLSRLDELVTFVPRSQQDLIQSYLRMEDIIYEYRELVRYIERAISLAEE